MTHLVVHGHFYQPPRENPWTEEVPPEPSAAPYHDWNARIAAESYRPNAFARVVDDRERVVAIVNNYARISFDVGPTLMTWFDNNAQEVRDRITDADRTGRGAMAQSYFHVILPLCCERDLRTNIRWGLAEFRHRFGREADGLWLPETAVDETVLSVLAEEGVRFTVLAPYQADRPIDHTRPYRWRDAVDLVFYDGDLSHAVAFENVSSQALVDRAVSAAGGLVVVATDGETFGHHQRYADRGLAYALTVEAPRRGVEVTVPLAYLDQHPATEAVGVVTSAWSCAHGVDRWREDCGCHTGGEPGWNQKWRGPLRQALDLVRDAAAEVFERRGAEVMKDPWAARDAYVSVLIGESPRDAFASAHLTGDEVEAFTLLEAQRAALAMYTSCGWFFNDLAGLETVIVLRYAARVIDFLAEVGEPADRLEARVLDVLATARSNDPAEGDGRDVWRRHVLPARVDAPRVVAHLALAELLEHPAPSAPLGGYDVEVLDHEHGDRGGLSLCSGRVALTHRRTGRKGAYAYAGLHLGGLEVLGAVRAADARRDAEALGRLRRAFAEGLPVTTVLRLVGDGFGPAEFDLSWALPGRADQILASAAQALAERFSRTNAELFEDHRATLTALARARFPIPRELRAPAALALARAFEAEVAAQQESWDPVAYRAAIDLAALAREQGVRLDTPEATATLQRIIAAAVDRAVADPLPAAVDEALALLRLAHDLGLHPDLATSQEVVYDALVGDRATPSLRLLGTALGLAVERLGEP